MANHQRSRFAGLARGGGAVEFLHQPLGGAHGELAPKDLVRRGHKPEDFPYWLITTKSMQYASGGNAAIQLMDEVAGNLWQRVMVTDQAGRTHLLDYQMVQTGQGWQINAVQLLPQAGVGA